jgi:spore coat protein U-like protein
VKPFIKLAFLGALLGFSGAANAALQCSIANRSQSLAFGAYDDSSPAPTDVSAAISVNCCRTGNPNPTVGNISITIGASTNSGQINTRQMKNSVNADLMSYQLYFLSFGGAVWGNVVNGGSAFTQSVSIGTLCVFGQQGVAVGTAIFGRIFPQQAVSAGNYADNLTITITP